MEKMRVIAAPCEKKREKKTMNAQGQVMVSLLSGRLIALKNRLQSSWDLVYTNKSENSI